MSRLSLISKIVRGRQNQFMRRLYSPEPPGAISRPHAGRGNLNISSGYAHGVPHLSQLRDTSLEPRSSRQAAHSIMSRLVVERRRSTAATRVMPVAKLSVIVPMRPANGTKSDRKREMKFQGRA